jgi:hypothetical protein
MNGRIIVNDKLLRTKWEAATVFFEPSYHLPARFDEIYENLPG